MNPDQTAPIREQSDLDSYCLQYRLPTMSQQTTIVVNSRKRFTVKQVLSGHSKIDKTKILMTSGSLMKVKSIIRLEKQFWSPFLSGRLRQVLLY